MSIFAIGDLHLSLDERIEKPMDVFGTAWENHQEKVKEYWTKTVTEADTVIICGDVSWGLKLDEAMADLTWVHHLPGRKVIVKGNHDLWWTSISRLNALFDDVFFLQNDAYPVDEDVCICGSRGWITPDSAGFTDHDRKIYDRELLRLRMSLEAGKKTGCRNIVAGLHYPPTGDTHQDSEVTRMLSEFGVRKCVYGHLHGPDAFKNGIKGILNSVDYQLVSLDYLKGQVKKIY